MSDLVHLAWTVKPIHDREKAYSIDVDGTMNVLNQAIQARVDYFLHTSSTLAYGAHPDNPMPLTEDSPLRGNPTFHYPYHKAIVEGKLSEFFQSQPDSIKMGILRPSAFLGPDLNNYITRILSAYWRTFFLMPYPEGSTAIQWTHIDDALQAFGFTIEKQLEGAYNVTPSDWVRMEEIPKILEKKKRGIRLPFWLLKNLSKIQWALRLSEAPPSYLDFIRFPFVASNQKLSKEGFKPTYSSIDALKSILIK